MHLTEKSERHFFDRPLAGRMVESAGVAKKQIDMSTIFDCRPYLETEVRNLFFPRVGERFEIRTLAKEEAAARLLEPVLERHRFVDDAEQAAFLDLFARLVESCDTWEVDLSPRPRRARPPGRVHGRARRRFRLRFAGSVASRSPARLASRRSRARAVVSRARACCLGLAAGILRLFGVAGGGADGGFSQKNRGSGGPPSLLSALKQISTGASAYSCTSTFASSNCEDGRRLGVNRSSRSKTRVAAACRVRVGTAGVSRTAAFTTTGAAVSRRGAAGLVRRARLVREAEPDRHLRALGKEHDAADVGLLQQPRSRPSIFIRTDWWSSAKS